MAAVTRVHGLGHAHGTMYSTANLKAMEVDCIANIATKGGIGSTIEAVFQAVAPLMAVSTGTAGKIFMIVDGHHNTAASLQARIVALGTVDSIDLTAATVTERDLDTLDATT
jgi:hypothetical protein